MLPHFPLCTRMALLVKERTLLLALMSLLCCFCHNVRVSAGGARYTPPPNVPRLTDLFSHVTFDQGFSQSFGGPNLKLTNNGSFVNLALDKKSGSGMASKSKYNYGFFSAAIKLPAGFTSGVVVAFYLSNSDVFPHNHDEIDIELLGREKRKDWVLQTNMYGNGDVKIGREEKFYLWFDPTLQYHHYSIIWNSHHIVILVDNIPVREVVHNTAITSAYPAKPMSVYGTIWDGSDWATHGGKYPVDYKYAPFVASLGQMEMQGCVLMNKKTAAAGAPPGDASSLCSKSGGLSRLDPVEGEQFVKLSQEQTTGLQWARNKLMFYSYCKDSSRYKVLPPECHA